MRQPRYAVCPLADEGYHEIGEHNQVRWYVEDTWTERIITRYGMSRERAEQVAREYNERELRACPR